MTDETVESMTAGDVISDLNPEWPSASISLRYIAHHARVVKKAWQQTFVNISATVSGVASELAFAHKGGTVSGDMMVKGVLSVNGNLAVQGKVTANNMWYWDGSTTATLFPVADVAQSTGFALSVADTQYHNGVKFYSALVRLSATVAMISQTGSLSATHSGTGNYKISHSYGDAHIAIMPNVSGNTDELRAMALDTPGLFVLTFRNRFNSPRDPLSFYVIVVEAPLT